MDENAAYFHSHHHFHCLLSRMQQFIGAGEGELHSLMNSAGTVGFISIHATAASASVNEACNRITMLTLRTPGSLTARQTHEIPIDMDDLCV